MRTTDTPAPAVRGATFTSVDGSERCRLCYLHEDTCTCRPDHPMGIILRAILPLMAANALVARAHGEGSR